MNINNDLISLLYEEQQRNKREVIGVNENKIVNVRKINAKLISPRKTL